MLHDPHVAPSGDLSQNAAMAEAPRVPLRRRLLLLAAAGLVPVVIMSGVGLYALARQQRTQAERIGLELARALATAVDAELRSSISVLQSLATTVEIDPRNLTAFRQQVQPVLETQPTWAALFLADPSGHRLVDTRFPLDATLPTVFETASFQRVVRTRAATVGGLARGADGVMLFAVRAPVLRAGRVALPVGARRERWGRIMASAWRHEKFFDVGPDAVALWAMALSWVMDNHTDGRIPARALPRILKLSPRRLSAAVARLTERRLWESDGTGTEYWVHDWTDYNPTEAQQQALRDVRQKAAQVRWGNKADANANALHVDKQTHSTCNAGVGVGVGVGVGEEESKAFCSSSGKATATSTAPAPTSASDRRHLLALRKRAVAAVTQGVVKPKPRPWGSHEEEK